MFQTFDSAKFPLPWGGEGANAWSYAELMVNAAWFYANCELTDGVDTLISTYLLSKSSQINDLQSNPDIAIQKIYIVSPPYINGSDSWEMSPLAKVSTGRIAIKDCEIKVEIYELENGKKYYSDSETQNDDNITNAQVIFSTSSS